MPGIEPRTFRLPDECSTIELHILCVSATRYTSPPDEAQSVKETDTMHTKVVQAACRMWVHCVKRDVIIAELAHHVGATNIAENIWTWLCRCSSLDYTPARLYPGLNWASLEDTPGVILS